MTADYRDQVARAIGRRLSGREDMPSYALADAVLAVRDAEMAALNGRLGERGGQVFELTETVAAKDAEIEELRCSRDGITWCIARDAPSPRCVERALAEQARAEAHRLSTLLRGMARRVRLYRNAGSLWHRLWSEERRERDAARAEVDRWRDAWQRSDRAWAADRAKLAYEEQQSVEVAAEMVRLRRELATSVRLPEDWRQQVITKFGQGPRRDGSPSPRSMEVIDLIESLRPAGNEPQGDTPVTPWSEWCEKCQDHVTGSHYHCGVCGKRSSMMGHAACRGIDLVQKINDASGPAVDEKPRGSWWTGLIEARLHRPWRERCGEPAIHPIRCRRDLSHLSPHIGLHGDEPITWDGEGNPTSAQATDHKCFPAMRSLSEVPGDGDALERRARRARHETKGLHS